MHILFMTPNFPPEVNAGATRQYEHCRRWVAAGHQVTVIAPFPNWPAGKVYPGYRNQWKSVEDMDGIRVLRVGTFISANQGFFWRSVGFISYMIRAGLAGCFTKNVDVLVSTSPHFFAGLAGTLTRIFKRFPFVLEIRDIWPESVLAVGAMKRSPVIRFLEWLEKKMYASADHIVTVGDGYRKQLLERGVADERISVVTNGVDLRAWQRDKSDDALRQEWKSEGKFVCAYVGTVGMAHGLEVVLDAAERLERDGRLDVVFWVVGDGARREALEAESKRRGLTNVVFTGQVPKSRVKEVLSSADACLVHLRGTELFSSVIPSKIFETMAMNTPIIMGVRGAAQDYVVGNAGGVAMTPDDASSLLNCIEQIKRSPASFSNGRQFVARRFNRDHLAADMLGILTEFAARDRQLSIDELTQPERDERRKAA